MASVHRSLASLELRSHLRERPSDLGAREPLADALEMTVNRFEAKYASDWQPLELTIDATEPPLIHLPRDWMYTAPVPRTTDPSPIARRS